MTPTASLRNAADTHRAGGQLGFATDTTSHPGHVLLALSLPCASCVLEIDAQEWSLEAAMTTLWALGFKPAEAPDAMTRAVERRESERGTDRRKQRGRA